MLANARPPDTTSAVGDLAVFLRPKPNTGSTGPEATHIMTPTPGFARFCCSLDMRPHVSHFTVDAAQYKTSNVLCFVIVTHLLKAHR